MAKDSCARCGFESSRDQWWDRHPAAAVLVALPTGYTIIGVILAYPWFFIPVLVIVCAVAVDRRQRRRAAIAARADHDHREQLVREVRAADLEHRRVLNRRLATALRSGRRRAADHWSLTEPIRQGDRR